MDPRHLLRIEGLAVFFGATVAYFSLGRATWLYLLLVLAPDLSMIGYLAGARVGSISYNMANAYLLSVAIAGIGVWQDTPIAILLALMWCAHIGIDRFVGYGLKYPTVFNDTHLARLSTDQWAQSIVTDPNE